MLFFDLLRAAVLGMGVLLLLIVCKAIAERWRDRHLDDETRTSAFGLASYVCFAVVAVLDNGLRFGEPTVTYRLPLALSGLVFALLGARGMFTFHVLIRLEARRARRAQTTEESHARDDEDH